MKAKTLMIQGTGSGVGKSLITAAFCRWFYKQGWRVAPYKAQNMSLNSFITEDGGEMGRAQVYQAEACGIKPHVSMNPVLLKPSGDNQSQIIVMGKVSATQNAKDYYQFRGKYIDQAKGALDDLRNQYEIVVLEGAGSPAEINLKSFDFVNMYMAEHAEAPVILVGDIDRGGVFAWIKGTYDLLEPHEQKRVCGIIINKFRGDIDLLKPGLKMLEDLIHKPVLGVLPFFRDLYVDEEDTLPDWTLSDQNTHPDALQIAILRLPRISNFTDFAPLIHDPNLKVSFIWHPLQLNRPHIIIIPGSKNTLEDLAFLKSQGLDKSLLQCHREGASIWGICAGFQMMGQRICDPKKVESQRLEMQGLGFFDVSTELKAQKTTRQVHCKTTGNTWLPDGLAVEGYEIHMGSNHYHSNYTHLFDSDKREQSYDLGIVNEEGSLIGTYLHGFLDNKDFRNSLFNNIRRKNGLPLQPTGFDYQALRNNSLDRLGKMIEDHLDMNIIQTAMGISPKPVSLEQGNFRA